MSTTTQTIERTAARRAALAALPVPAGHYWINGTEIRVSLPASPRDRRVGARVQERRPAGLDLAAGPEFLLRQIATDPAFYMAAFTRRCVRCACCGRELSHPTSVEIGIGPICSGRLADAGLLDAYLGYAS